MKENKELITYVIDKSITKANRDILRLSILGILAGMSISLGAVANLVVSSDFYTLGNAGVGKFVGAAVFPVGLMIIVFLGYDLFTSNCLLISAVYEKKINILQFIKNLILILFFNLLGCLFIAYITAKTGTLSENSKNLLFSLSEHKVNTNAINIILKGILCNFLVCSATLLGYGCKNAIGKIFGIWFPIMLFIVLGYDHVVANMLYLPTAYILGSDITLSQIIYNLFFATIGNFIGGSFLALTPLYIMYKK